MSSAVYGVLERADEHLAHVLSQWSILTTILALAIAGLVAYNVWTWEDPDTSPFLLARQSSAAPIRNPGESAAYRSLETPHGYPLRSGLDIRDHDTPRWSPGRDGDLRDLWRSAVRGRPGPDGRPTGQTGKILTVRGREEIVEHSIAELSQTINIIGQELRELGGKRVAIYLPNSVEFLSTLFAGAFDGFSVILLPYRQSIETVVGLLRKTQADILIAGAGTLPLADVVSGHSMLEHVIWVVQQGSRHLDWSEVPEGIGGRVGVAVWHELIEEKKKSRASEHPPLSGDDERRGHPGNIVTVWQKKEDNVREVIEYSQGNVVAAIAALISSLPARERFSPSDLLLPVEALDAIYPLTLTLAALYSNASVALNSVAGLGADLNRAARVIAPTIIVASAETISDYHKVTAHMSRPGLFSALWHFLQARTLAAGRMPRRAMIDSSVLVRTGPSSTAAVPGKLRLVFVSERAHTDCPTLTSAELSDLRILTGARLVYALTAPGVAGAVAATNVYDYRRQENPIVRRPGDQVRQRHCSHFGVPMSSLEITLVDTDKHQTTDEGNPEGEITVKGPAVVGNHVKLGIIGTFRDDHTLAYV